MKRANCKIKVEKNTALHVLPKPHAISIFCLFFFFFIVYFITTLFSLTWFFFVVFCGCWLFVSVQIISFIFAVWLVPSWPSTSSQFVSFDLNLCIFCCCCWKFLTISSVWMHSFWFSLLHIEFAMIWYHCYCSISCFYYCLPDYTPITMIMISEWRR